MPVSSRILLLIILLLTMGATAALAEQCARPGANGGGAPSGVVNTYFPGASSANAGATTISLGAASGASVPIAVGDMLLVIQMQGATINSNNNSSYGSGTAGTYASGYSAIGQTGLYEFVRAASAVSTGGGTVTIVGGSGGGLINAYVDAAATNSAGQRTFQVIRVPQYTNVTVSSAISALPWNGATGGVLAIDVADRLTFAGGTLDASGLGFRGGGALAQAGSANPSSTDYRSLATRPAHAAKGEGIAGTPTYVSHNGALLNTGAEGYPNGSNGRGAPGNAGGGGNDGNPAANDQNTGGGGGGNAGQGGRGGHAWCSAYASSCPQTGGHPGATAPNGSARLIMGGGGGAGTNNNNTGSPAGLASSGAAGGGIVILRAGEVSGAGTISASGASASSTVGNDGTGGGGAGGTVLVTVLRNSGGGSVTVQAEGGDGGSNTGGGAPHGPGGGGGGGYVASNGVAPLSASVWGGSAGTTAGGGFAGGINYGALPGSGGTTATIAAASVVGVSAGCECTPTIVKTFGTSPVSPGSPSVMSVAVTNNNPDLALTSMAFTDTYPSGLVNAAAPNPTRSCTTATLSAAANGGSFAVSAATVPAASTCTYTVTTTVTSSGDKVNTIPAGGLTGSYGAVAVASLDPGSATIQVSAPLTIVKSSLVYSDPLNNTLNAKLIPGSYVYYTVTIANPGGVPVTSGSILITDATPANLSLYVANLPGHTGPLLFGAGSSGATFTFSGLASATDDIEFSNNGGSTWTYVPAANSAGVDPAVTHMRIRPKGTMAAGSSFTLNFGYLVK
ncbi:MAG TPA: hypothetical protein VF650_01700 [Allosphingosinicella sp.]|jgi:uncharacterized repeat protein (TIGR01451 family)